MYSDLIPLVLVAFGLSADCFAVALSSSVSSCSNSWPRVFRVAFSFGAFQALMPALGWLLGRTFVDFISGFDHWIAFALLGFVGGKMLYRSLRAREGREGVGDITRGWGLITMSIATSIDALAVGLSLALLDTNVLLASLVIGVVAAGITATGFMVGRRAGKMMGRRAETLGGLILLAIAVRILLSDLF